MIAIVSPSPWRAWIEITLYVLRMVCGDVALPVEGVD